MKVSQWLSLAVASTVLSVSMTGCGKTECNDEMPTDQNGSVVDYSANVPTAGALLPYSVLDNTIEDGKKPGSTMEVRNGGYGSAASAHPTHKNQFYAMTDRGPNATFTGDDGKGKMFPTADYTPRIGLFEIQSDGSVKKLKDILLKRPDGTPITGLPNTSALGGTGETPYDKEGNTIKGTDGEIKLDDYGLDGEGLAALDDGTFWVSDEYGPHMVHFDAEGKEIGRINPFAEDTRNIHTLPEEFAHRRANRGMEGLTITSDQKTLVGIMQSTMDLPSKDVRNNTLTRIVTVDIATGVSKQYLYKQEKAANSNSEIVALSADEFLVIERDGAFYAGGPKAADPEAQKHIYRIKLSTGTELENVALDGEMVQEAALGLTIQGKTLEEIVYGEDGSDLSAGWAMLAEKGIYPVSKELVVDMVKEVGYPHDKMEGLVVFQDGNLGVLNDDDFATWSTGGVLEQKYLNEALTQVDQNTLYVVKNPLLRGDKLVKIGTYDTGKEAGAEIVAFDKDSKRMFVTNGDAKALDIITITDPSNPTLVRSIDITVYGKNLNSVASKNGKVAVAVEDGNETVGKKQGQGHVVIFDTEGNHLKTVDAGYLPDMVTFNEDGTKIIVANEGEPNDLYTVDPIGSVGIIDVHSDYAYTDVRLGGMTTDANDGTPVRLGGTPSADQEKDLEPEYIAVHGEYAYVTLQENNAMAKVNLTDHTVEYIKSFGAKRYGEDSGNTIDIEEEKKILMKSYPALMGLYMPDSIVAFENGGNTYLATANEGDGREYIVSDINQTECDAINGDFDGETNECTSFIDEAKIKKLDLDPAIADAYTDENDLKVVTDMGDSNHDGIYESLYTYGARSFSIWNAMGDLVWDSGDDISKRVAQAQPALFNQDEDEMDGRSGNKGAEPEALAIGQVNGKTYAFVGLERQNAIVVYDISDIQKVKFVDYLETESMGDISAEGMKFVPASESPNGKSLLLVSFEVSGSTVIYEVK